MDVVDRGESLLRRQSDAPLLLSTASRGLCLDVPLWGIYLSMIRHTSELIMAKQHRRRSVTRLKAAERQVAKKRRPATCQLRRAIFCTVTLSCEMSFVLVSAQIKRADADARHT